MYVFIAPMINREFNITSFVEDLVNFTQTRKKISVN